MLRVCGGLDLHGDGVEVDVGQSGICGKVVVGAGVATCILRIWFIYNLVKCWYK